MKKIFLIIVTVMFLLVPSNIVAADDILDGFAIDVSLLTSDLRIGQGTSYALQDSSNTIHVSYLKLTTDGMIAYCSDGTKTMFIADSNLGEIAFDSNCKVLSDKQARIISYIFENGYKGEDEGEYTATNYLTGVPLKDYYITQIAVWYYTVSSTTYKNDFDFTNNTFNGKTNDVISRGIKLITDAKAAGDGATLKIDLSDNTMALTSDEKYYISDGIKLTGTYLNSKITTSVSGPKGIFVTTDKNATSGSNVFENGSTVYIKVPAENVNTGSTTVNLAIKANTYIEKSSNVECEFALSEEFGGIQPMVIHYEEDSELADSKNLTITKRPVYSVEISKKDNNGEMLEGATLVLKSGSEIITSWVSTNEAKTISLYSGEYTLEETIAPGGYAVFDEGLTFIIDESGIIYIDNSKVDEIALINEPIMITISKREKNKDEELVGATLRIIDEEGNVVKDMSGNLLEWTTTDEEKSFHVASGTYVLEEVSAPEGYELSDKVIKFTVNKDGTVTVKEGLLISKDKVLENNLIIFENVPEPQQVESGSALLYSAITIGLASLGVSMFLVFRKKRI